MVCARFRLRLAPLPAQEHTRHITLDTRIPCQTIDVRHALNLMGRPATKQLEVRCVSLAPRAAVLAARAAARVWLLRSM